MQSPVQPARQKLPPTVVGLGLVSLFTDASSEAIFPLLPAFVASTTFGWVWDRFGSIAAFAGSGAIALVAAAMLMRAVPRR